MGRRLGEPNYRTRCGKCGVGRRQGLLAAEAGRDHRAALAEVVAPGGRLTLCGYGSPRSGVRPEPVCATVRSWGFEPELELCAPAPEGGPIVEVAALRA